MHSFLSATPTHLQRLPQRALKRDNLHLTQIPHAPFNINIPLQPLLDLLPRLRPNQHSTALHLWRSGVTLLDRLLEHGAYQPTVSAFSWCVCEGRLRTAPKPERLIVLLQPAQMVLPNRDTLLQRALVVRYDDEPLLQRRTRGCHTSYCNRSGGCETRCGVCSAEERAEARGEHVSMELWGAWNSWVSRGG